MELVIIPIFMTHRPTAMLRTLEGIGLSGIGGLGGRSTRGSNLGSIVISMSGRWWWMIWSKKAKNLQAREGNARVKNLVLYTPRCRKKLWDVQTDHLMEMTSDFCSPTQVSTENKTWQRSGRSQLQPQDHVPNGLHAPVQTRDVESDVTSLQCDHHTWLGKVDYVRHLGWRWKRGVGGQKNHSNCESHFG